MMALVTISLLKQMLPYLRMNVKKCAVDMIMNSMHLVNIQGRVTMRQSIIA